MVNNNLMKRPKIIGTAVNLLYISLILGVLTSIFDFTTYDQMPPSTFVWTVSLGVLGSMWLFIYLIDRGYNWSRITFLVMFIIGMPFFVIFTQHTLTANPISGLLSVGQTLIQLVALVLLFLKPSSEWFRKVKIEKRINRNKIGEKVSNSVEGEEEEFDFKICQRCDSVNDSEFMFCENCNLRIG